MATKDDVAIIAVTSDWHVNDTVALCPPVVELDDGGRYHPSPRQQQIWGYWTRYWGIIARQKERLDATVYCIANGDLGDLNRHSQSQLISPAAAPVLTAMWDVTEPARKVCDHWFIVRGTEAHTRDLGELEEELAKALGAERAPSGTWSWWHLRAKVNGVRIDATHHPATSSRRPWTRAQSASRQAAIVRADYIEAGDQPPDLAFYGHQHYFADSGRTFKPQAIYLPSWKGIGAFGHRLGAGPHGQPVGGVYAVIREGRYWWEPVLFRGDVGDVWGV